MWEQVDQSEGGTLVAFSLGTGLILSSAFLSVLKLSFLPKSAPHAPVTFSFFQSPCLSPYLHNQFRSNCLSLFCFVLFPLPTFSAFAFLPCWVISPAQTSLSYRVPVSLTWAPSPFITLLPPLRPRRVSPSHVLSLCDHQPPSWGTLGAPSSILSPNYAQLIGLIFFLFSVPDLSHLFLFYHTPGLIFPFELGGFKV